MIDKGRSENIKRLLLDNAVTILFLTLSILGVVMSGMKMNKLVFQLMERISRNAFIVLALIIPIVAGMGINFAITIGAMAAQIAILLVMNWRVPGLGGFFLAVLISIPIATVFGYLVGNLLNKMKGQETIGSMILGYFANGLYQLLFLYIFGNIIKISNPDLLIVGSTGVRSTLDMFVDYGFRRAIDNAVKVRFEVGIYIACGIGIALILFMMLKKRYSLKKGISLIIIMALGIVGASMPGFSKRFAMTKVPLATFGMVALLCVFNVVIMRTRLGQKFRAVGQSQQVANAAGINVNRVRIQAIILSTVLAGIGQIIYLQNLGQMQTYSAHEQVGLYAGAAILVGGASIVKANNTQAIIGCVLFHALFIIVPEAISKVSNNALIGEHLRAFISYGAITLALVLHGLRSRKKTPAELVKEVAGKA